MPVVVVIAGLLNRFVNTGSLSQHTANDESRCLQLKSMQATATTRGGGRQRLLVL